MSIISKIAVIGITSIGAVIAVAGTTGGAAAEEVNDTCHGQVVLGDYNDRPGDDGNLVVNPGETERGRIDLNNQGWVRWYCNNGEGLIANREDCMDGGNEAIVQVRLRNNGDLRIICS
jgi:hypothetical protein